MKLKFLKPCAILACVFFASISAGLSGCAAKKDSGGKTKVRVALDWTPNTNHSGVYAAVEKGFFEEEGLSVEIMQPPEDGALLLTASGGAEYCFDFQESMGPAIALASNPLPVKAVAAVAAHNTSGILSRRDSPVKRPKDLEGKKFCVWETPLVVEITRAIVEGDGGDFSKVNMISDYALDAISALQSGIDSIWIYYGWDGVKASISGLDAEYIDFKSIDEKFDFYTPVLVINTNYANENPALVKKFMSAVSKGYNYAIEFPKEAADALLKAAPELEAELVYKSQEYLSKAYRADSPVWGWIDAKRWSGFYEWMYSKGLLQTDLKEAGFTNEYLPQ
ncbi:MAG: ABC transporter substrate-binding protein [Spirochaetaceae bacterium]|nr:ABC transporter substrate-binding protein [Spirochaetaceae bacterium]